MNKRYCPECGHEHPADARFCMYCGYMLTDGPAPPAPAETGGKPAPAHAPQERGTDWAAIVAAILAFVGLRHASRKARQTAVVIALFMIFFGCPMACGLVSLVMQWFNQLAT